MNKQYMNLPKDFDYKIYLLLNKDVANDNVKEEEAKDHYNKYGYLENRKYKFQFLPVDFDYKQYLMLNKDVEATTEEEAMIHYEYNGYFENRKYKEDYLIVDMKKKIMKKFLLSYNISSNQIVDNPKWEFRYICFKSIPYIRQIKLSNIQINSKYEAVLVEFRCFPHLEFLIRNTIIKLGEKWSHTIICGNINKEFIKKMVNKISPNIKVIETNYNNITPSEYSKLLASNEFWDLIYGEKILIYQEDSIIFKKNITDFLHWDYIGAPWPENSNNNNNNVGNGGLSLRSKSIMKKIIRKISIEKTVFNQSTIEYIQNTNSTIPPEDVYFSKNMEDLQIGKLADRNSAYQFSTESIQNENSFGGHNIWISNSNWRELIYKNNIISFNANYNTSCLEHRGGWKTVLEKMIKQQFYSKNTCYEFFDMLESQFLWRNDYVCFKKWSGIIHCTQFTPPYLNIVNITYLFDNPMFIESLKNCFLLFTLSQYITNYLDKRINDELKFNIPIYTLKHPVQETNIPLFDFNKFLINENKMIIQLGQQLRKLSSIYLINANGYEKLWLTGSKNLNKVIDLLWKEIHYLNINKNKLDISVKIYYTETYEEYDELLTKNVVFIDLFDAAANNSVVECIIRNTPIIINKIGGVVEYLGENYPLYFNTLEDVPSLLSIEKIKEGYEYLLNMNKKDLSIDYFVCKLNNIIYENINSKLT
jgi:hypothetical protein